MKIINWLLQPTANGATYLQAIILSLFTFIIVSVVIRNIKSLIKDYKSKGIYK